MGAGVGLSMATSLRIGTPDLQWAMPETAIGFFPDVGASYFLRQAPSFIGVMLGLTGRTISADCCHYAGFIDYITHISSTDLIQQLAQTNIQRDGLQPFIDIVQQQHVSPKPNSWLANHVSLIEQTFSQPSLEAINASIAALQPLSWAEEIATLLASRCPRSLAVSTQLLHKSQPPTLQTALAQEFQIACHLSSLPDFKEGIRAQLIDKDKQPAWEQNIDTSSVNACFQPTQTPLFTDTSL